MLDIKYSDYHDKHILFELLIQQVGYEKACTLFEESRKFYYPLEKAIREANNSISLRS